jgi:hypothetical protein
MTDSVSGMSPDETQALRQTLVNYVREFVQWGRMRLNRIETREDLQKLKAYHPGLQPDGKNWIMVFTKQNNRYYSYFLERCMVYGKPGRVVMFKVKAKMSIYDGTIIEGTMTPNKSTGTDVFVMTDVFWLKGKDVGAEDWIPKMETLKSYIDNALVINPVENKFLIEVETGRQMGDLRKLVNEGMKTCTWKTRGLVFYPPKYGPRWVFSDEPRSSKMQPDTGHIGSDSSSSDGENDSSDTDSDVVEAVFEVRKTEDQPDVYELWAKNSSKSKRAAKLVNIGIAKIPTLKISRYCDEQFSNSKKPILFMRCKWSSDHGGWVPVETVTNKRVPDPVPSSVQ